MQYLLQNILCYFIACKKLNGFVLYVQTLSTNVKYDSSMVKFSDLKNNEGKKWTQNSTFKKRKKFNKASISIWKSKLNKNIIKLVEFFCWKEMSSFGYKLKYKKRLVNN